MADKEQIIKEKVAHSGIFTFSDLYSYMHDWLKEEEGYGVIEERYSEKVSGASREIDVEWSAAKRISDYFKIELKIEFEVNGLTDVEVEIDGVKKKSQKGKI